MIYYYLNCKIKAPTTLDMWDAGIGFWDVGQHSHTHNTFPGPIDGKFVKYLYISPSNPMAYITTPYLFNYQY